MSTSPSAKKHQFTRPASKISRATIKRFGTRDAEVSVMAADVDDVAQLFAEERTARLCNAALRLARHTDHKAITGDDMRAALAGLPTPIVIYGGGLPPVRKPQPKPAAAAPEAVTA